MTLLYFISVTTYSLTYIFFFFSHFSLYLPIIVPFFFNKDNGDYICGYFKCSFVQEWAGVPIDTSLDPKY